MFESCSPITDNLPNLKKRWHHFIKINTYTSIHVKHKLRSILKRITIMLILCSLLKGR